MVDTSSRTTISDPQFSVNYADVYDLLHLEKPYEEEVDLVLNMVRDATGRAPESMLDLACGTGKHIALFSQRGLYVHGNDLSEGMIGCAEKRLREIGAQRYRLTTSPMQVVRASAHDGDGFDLVTAFYTAMGYVVEPGELDKLLVRIQNLVKPGGCFFADLWNGHKMASGFSAHREKTAEDDRITVHRESSVRHLPARNALDVHFSFRLSDKQGRELENFEESHQVRYHTPFEVENLLLAHGFEEIRSGPFFDDARATEDAWNFFVFSRRVA